jgi:hypothetical protein
MCGKVWEGVGDLVQGAGESRIRGFSRSFEV